MEYSIRPDLCISCGLCLDDCPTNSVRHERQTSEYRIDRAACIACSHCAMVCPVDAVQGGVGDRIAEKPLAYESVRNFLRGRRSVRRYRRREVGADLIHELLAEASLVSSGTNAQDWEAVVVSGEAVGQIGNRIVGFWQKLIGLVGIPGVRQLAYLTQARKYVANRHAFRRNRDRINAYFTGEDWLFWQAPAVILLTYPKRNRRLGPTNCVLAGSRFMNLAMAKGLGSCMIGFATIAVNSSPSVKRELKIERSRRVGLTFTLGYPDVEYLRYPNRPPMPFTAIPGE